MSKVRFVHTCLLISTTMLGAGALPGPALAQSDPGPRPGAPGAGGPLLGLNNNEMKFFAAAQAVFQEVDTVPTGLGPRFNSNSCSSCHAQPDVGGSSPALNPQIAAARAAGATNTIPSFITANGPTREARFVNNPDGTPDGGVHDLFVITGRTDAPGCNIAQPDFTTQLANNNVIFRIPTPTFGLGLVESVSDANLQARFNDNANLRVSFGVILRDGSGNPVTDASGNAVAGGHFNRTGNDGSITRFGWKAQNKSLLIFAGEAYNVEQGVTNEAFPNERETDPACTTNATPEDSTVLDNVPNSKSKATDFSSDVVNFAGFMRLSAPPTPTADFTQTSSPNYGGYQVFKNIGCHACHAVNLVLTDRTNAPHYPLSDFAVHSMGAYLADRITQGNAGGDEFRTAPLWGLGQRLFFLHDGSATDLVTAITKHSDITNPNPTSEANTVIGRFNGLSSSELRNLMTFLRSL